MSRTAERVVRPAEALPAVRRGAIVDPVVVGAIAGLLAVAFSWVPSVWYDEAATVVSATRSWPELARMIGTVDLVHAAYYSLMHVWFDLVGYSPFTLRLPSSVAIGVAAGGLVALLRGFVPRSVAVLAGLVFAVLPRTLWAGGEGRSYAMGIALAVGLAAVYIFATRGAGRGRRRFVLGWVAYAAVAVLACSVFLYLALVVAAAGATALWSAVRLRWSRPALHVLLGWAVSSAVAAAALAPLARGITAQSGQVDWILPLGDRTLRDVLVAQSFGGAVWLAVLVWGLALVGVAALLLRRAGAPVVPARPASPSLVELLVPFIVVPVAGLLAASVLISPLYSPRYLAFTTLAVAAFAAVGIAALPTRLLPTAALVGVIALAIPPAIEQRIPTAKQYSSWNQAADILAQQRAGQPAGTREGVVFGELRRHPKATTRVIEYTYPDAFRGLDDPALLVPAARSGQLWEERAPLSQVLDDFGSDTTVWLFTSNQGTLTEDAIRELGTVGLKPTEEWHLSYLDMVRLDR